MTDSLTPEESEAVLIALTQHVSANLPLHTALTALAEESTSPQAQRVLRELDRRLQAGEAPSSVIGTLQMRLPAVVAKLLQGGLEIGRLDLIMQFLVNQKQWDREFRHRLLMGLAYPSIVLFFFGVWVSSILLAVIPGFQRVFDDFGTELPGITLLLFWLSSLLNHTGVFLIPVLIAAIGFGWYTLTFGDVSRLFGRSRLNTPIIGPMLNLRQFSEFCDMLAILVEGRLALPKALQFAAAGLSNPDLQSSCLNLARRIEQGEPVAFAANQLNLPHAFTLVLQQSADEMARNLRTLSGVYATKGDFSIRAMAMSLDVMVMLSVSILLIATLAGLFLPLIKLLNDLS